MKKNDIFDIEITGMTDDGNGVGRAEQTAIFVPYTIVGEKVKVHIIKVNKNYAVGKLIEVLKPSEMRIKAECPYFYKCGGCQLWHMDYKAELEYKQNKVAECIKRIGGLDITVSKIIAAPHIKRYRNKVQLPISDKGIGFYRKNSHDVIDMEDCLLQQEKIKLIAKAVKNWMKDYKISAYDEESNKGLLRHIYTRSCDNGIVFVLVCTSSDLPHKNELISLLLDLNIGISGIVLNVNAKQTNVVMGRENIVLWGESSIRDTVNQLEFEISPNSFYQVNKEQMCTLYSEAKRMANLSGRENVWDVYCGTGTIGQFMADSCKSLVGIEIVPDAVKNAEFNAKINNIKNTSYYCGAAEKLAPKLVKDGLKPDVVILDPPRKGCDSTLIDSVVASKPKRIVYISCKPSTLARDLKIFNNKGYVPQEIVPVDMFPRTSHVETVVLLSHKKPDGHINVKVEFGEGDGKVPLDDIAERAENYKPKERVTYKMIKEYIEAKYGFKVHTAYIAEVKRELGLPMYDAPNAVEELKNPRKHPTPEKVDAIKDALKHFEII